MISKIKKFSLLGWNENTIACLRSLIKNNFFPTEVIVPEGHDYQKLKSLCVRNRLTFKILSNQHKLKESIIDVDCIISASWPQIIDYQWIKDKKILAINVHGSFLPLYRGRHPLNWAILNDEKEIGVTVHLISEDVDAGPILCQDKFLLSDDDYICDIRKKAHLLGGELIVKALKAVNSNNITASKQNEAQATFYPPRKPSDGKIDWNRPIREINNLIRATSRPGPGAFSYIRNNKIIIWRCKIEKDFKHLVSLSPGHFEKKENGITVRCIDGLMRVESYDGQVDVNDECFS